MADQLPPADELFAVRAEIKRLTGRERDLRSLLLSDPSARTGNNYAAVVTDVTTKRTDVVEMRKCHPDLVAEFTFPLTTQTVEVRGISEDGELVPTRRFSVRSA